MDIVLRYLAVKFAKLATEAKIISSTKQRKQITERIGQYITWLTICWKKFIEPKQVLFKHFFLM